MKMNKTLFGIGIMLAIFCIGTNVNAEKLLSYGTDSENTSNLYTIESDPPGANTITQNLPCCFSEIEFNDNIIYGADTFESTILQFIDAETKRVYNSLELNLPPEGDVITALGFAEGTLFGGLSTIGEGTSSYLVSINTETGLVSNIGKTDVNKPLGGLAYDSATSTMYACTAGGGPGMLLTVDLSSGATTTLGDITVEGADVGTTALAFGPSGVLYTLPNKKDPLAGHLLSVNLQNGQADDLGDLGVQNLNALARHPATVVEHQRIVIPYYTKNDPSWWTGIAVHNPTDTTSCYCASVYNSNGNLVGETQFTLDPKAQYIGLPNDFSGTTTPARGSLHIVQNYSEKFDATIFTGNNDKNKGFGTTSYRSHEYDPDSPCECP